jgi:fumarate reductase subunit C
MTGWWKRDPFFVRYMIREVTALAVAAYAIVLLVGVVRLAQGEAAFNGYVAALGSPLSVVFHLMLLAGMAYHTYSWFDIMPKTMPLLFAGGKRVAESTITGVGLAAAAVVSVVVLAIAWGLK